MRQKQINTLTDSQKKRVIQWEIPHLVHFLEEKYQLSVMHLITSVLVPLSENDCFHNVTRILCEREKSVGACFYKRRWLNFNGKTGFPIFVGKDFFGLLVFFDALSFDKAHYVRGFIDDHFQKLFKRGVKGVDKELPSKDFIPDSVGSNFCEVCVHVFRRKKIPMESAGKQLKNINRRNLGLEITSQVGQDQYKSLFPLLLQREQKEGLLKTAHNIYLKTSAFAFLNSEALQWKEGIFQEMNDVFVCIPSFHKLSFFQKKILIKSLLKKKLSCRLVVGIKKPDDLPIKCRRLFPFAL